MKKKRIYRWCPDQSWCPNLDKRKIVRCPTCNRRLLPREQVGGEFGYKLPPHKTYKNAG